MTMIYYSVSDTGIPGKKRSHSRLFHRKSNTRTFQNVVLILSLFFFVALTETLHKRVLRGRTYWWKTPQTCLH